MLNIFKMNWSHLLGCFLFGGQHTLQLAEQSSPCPIKAFLTLDPSRSGGSGPQRCHQAGTVERPAGIAG